MNTQKSTWLRWRNAAGNFIGDNRLEIAIFMVFALTYAVISAWTAKQSTSVVIDQIESLRERMDSIAVNQDSVAHAIDEKGNK